MSDPAIIDRAVRGSELSPLTREQKTRIILLAKDAYEKVGCRTGQEFNEWRHEQQDAACGRSSLCTATQRDFRAIRGHFFALLGRKRAAFKDFVASETSDTGFAMAKLKHECEAARDVIEAAEEYVRKIAQSRFKTRDLSQLSSKQVWSLVFDIRRNAQRRRRKKV